MIEVLTLMIGGMITGYLLRGKVKLIRLVDKLIIWSIFLLLFLLGLGIGSSPELMSRLPSLGFSALLFSLGGILGSILLGLFIWKLYFSGKSF